jgi:hypothetical protein
VEKKIRQFCRQKQQESRAGPLTPEDLKSIFWHIDAVRGIHQPSQ